MLVFFFLLKLRDNIKNLSKIRDRKSYIYTRIHPSLVECLNIKRRGDGMKKTLNISIVNGLFIMEKVDELNRVTQRFFEKEEGLQKAIDHFLVMNHDYKIKASEELSDLLGK
jgi:hypothetical protein